MRNNDINNCIIDISNSIVDISNVVVDIKNAIADIKNAHCCYQQLRLKAKSASHTADDAFTEVKKYLADSCTTL
jgi:hypothetical protein